MRDQSFQRWKTRANLGRPKIARGFTILEIIAATAITAIIGASLVVALLAARKSVASARAINAARLIVQRNIDQALNVPLLSNVITKPPILAITGTAGVPYNDNVSGATATSGTSIPILYGIDGTVLLSGTLTRIVTQEPVPGVTALSDVSSTHLLRVTFKIDYHYLRRNQSFSLSTIRSQDDQ